MKKKKITFSEPNCRFGCPHFKSVGSVLNETCYCMKKGKKGRRLGKKDLKRRPPEWCPRRLKTPVCRTAKYVNENLHRYTPKRELEAELHRKSAVTESTSEDSRHA